MRAKLGLAQIDTVLGNVQANLETHLQIIDRAKANGVELLCFPELSLTGYSLQDLTYSVALQPEANDVFAPLLEASHNLDLVVGFVEEDARHRFYVSLAYLSGGAFAHVHRKVYLPTYTLFDEGRFFAAGEDVRAFDTRFGRAGLLICEDFWHVSLPYLLWLDGADILLFASATPGRGLDEKSTLASVRWAEQAVATYAAFFTTFVANINRVGVEDGVIFGGGSLICGPEGNSIAQASYIDEHLLITDINLADLRRARTQIPLLRDERPELTARTLKRILNKRFSGG